MANQKAYRAKNGTIAQEASSKKTITVEVVYARAHDQQLVSVELAAGSTVMDAVDCSRLLEALSSASQAQLKFGIFGKVVLKPEEYVLTEGERVEIYRPLIADPKVVRKQRAEKAKQARS